jgi:hypothetical protein
MALANWQQDRINIIRNRLHALTTEVSPCGVDAEHKMAVRLYVESWILPHVEVLAGIVKRNGPDDLGDDDRAVARENWPRAYGFMDDRYHNPTGATK